MARYTPGECLENIKDYFSVNLPPVLAEAGLTAFDDYLDTPPNNDEALQCCVYLAEGSDALNSTNFACLIQAQLYQIDSPKEHLGQMWELAQKYNPGCLGFTDRNLTWQTWYPGEQGDGYGSSFVLIEFQLTRENDDCYLDDEIC